jgi:hypothetical protein
MAREHLSVPAKYGGHTSPKIHRTYFSQLRLEYIICSIKLHI